MHDVRIASEIFVIADLHYIVPTSHKITARYKPGYASLFILDLTFLRHLLSPPYCFPGRYHYRGNNTTRYLRNPFVYTT